MQQFDLSRRLAAEAIGTAGLLAVVVGSGIMGESLAGGNVAIARSSTDTFSGIAPGHAPGFILAELVGAASATLVFAWLLFPSPVEEQAVADSAE